MKSRLNKGLTLIEMLIVVAIISILSMIGVPNFLEAQTRGKISRVTSDLHLISTALEAYFANNEAYPPNIASINNDNFWENGLKLNMLTTPIAYMSSEINLDPFDISYAFNNKIIKKDSRGYFSSGGGGYYIGGRYYQNSYNGTIKPPYKYLNIFEPKKGGTSIKNVGRTANYMLISIGPDRGINYSYEDIVETIKTSKSFVSYDPTNGTISRGEIFNFGE